MYSLKVCRSTAHASMAMLHLSQSRRVRARGGAITLPARPLSSHPAGSRPSRAERGPHCAQQAVHVGGRELAREGVLLRGMERGEEAQALSQLVADAVAKG